MSIANNLYDKLKLTEFSYGETVSMILENKGKSISSLPNEDFIFEDNSVLRVTNSGVRVLEFLQE